MVTKNHVKRRNYIGHWKRRSVGEQDWPTVAVTISAVGFGLGLSMGLDLSTRRRAQGQPRSRLTTTLFVLLLVNLQVALPVVWFPEPVGHAKVKMVN
jgi:hypothetical protein